MTAAGNPKHDASAGDSRKTPMIPYWNGSTWTIYLPTANGPIPVPCPAVSGPYIASNPASPDDVYVEFVDFVWHHACWPQMHRPFGSLTWDIFNVGTTLAKIDHFFALGSNAAIEPARCVETEIEYLLMVLRSMFDLLHDASCVLWMSAGLSTEAPSGAGKKRQQLPKLSKLLFQEDKVRAALDPRFGLPEQICSAYLEAASFIYDVRRLRDAIAHHGGSAPSIHRCERGFCVSADEDIVENFGPFPEEAYLNADLLSLRPLLAKLVGRTIRTCDAIAGGFRSSIAFPEPVAPGLRVYLRHRHVASLSKIYPGECPLWWGSDAG